MAQVTITPEFHIILPEDTRDALKIRPGEKWEVFHLDNQIRLVRVLPMQEMRGFVKGLDTSSFERDPDRL
jgi:bifunctional DNA-binding transcriptional regulator/antitoxin component of YhaV-PrlF toxin-antitoxin module